MQEKQLYGYFKWQTGETVPEKIYMWLRSVNLKREANLF